MLIKAIPDISDLEKWLALDLPFEYNDFMHPSVLDDKAETKKRIEIYNSVNRDRSYDTLHGPFYDIAVHSADPKIRAVSDSRIRQACDIAVSLKVSGIVFHTNLIANFYNKQYRENWLSANAQYFNELLKDYKKLNIYMENMFDNEPDSLCALAGKIDSERFGICLDIGHCNISNTDIATWIDSCEKHIKQCHINDNDGTLDSHLAVGDGNIDWNMVLKALDDSIPVLIEVSEYSDFIKSRDYIRLNAF